MSSGKELAWGKLVVGDHEGDKGNEGVTWEEKGVTDAESGDKN
jgi:hypothetical protein